MRRGECVNKSKGWIKYFADGEIEIGSDILIDQGKASWRNGRLNDITSVEIIENEKTYSLTSIYASKWWQGDDYYASYSGPNKAVPGKLVRRFVQFKIEQGNIGKHIVLIKLPTGYKIVLRDNAQNSLFQILPEHLGMWLTLSIKPGIDRPGLGLNQERG